MRTCVHACMHDHYMHGRMHQCPHACLHACTHVRMDACTHTHMHARTCTSMYSCTHARTHLIAKHASRTQEEQRAELPSKRPREVLANIPAFSLCEKFSTHYRCWGTHHPHHLVFLHKWGWREIGVDSRISTRCSNHCSDKDPKQTTHNLTLAAVPALSQQFENK